MYGLKKSEVWFQFLLASFMSLIVVSNVITGKLIQLGPFTVPGATLLYPFTFLVTDLVGELWGKERGYRLVLWGVYGNAILLIASIFIIRAPYPGFFENQSAYEVVLGATPRIIVGSMIAYLLSQFHDVWAFSYWKQVTKGKYKWIRNNFSTMSSQLIDTSIFVLIAFYGTVPNAALWQIATSQYIVKFIIAGIDTPVFYWASSALQKVFAEDAQVLG